MMTKTEVRTRTIDWNGMRTMQETAHWTHRPSWIDCRDDCHDCWRCQLHGQPAACSDDQQPISGSTQKVSK